MRNFPWRTFQYVRTNLKILTYLFIFTEKKSIVIKNLGRPQNVQKNCFFTRTYQEKRHVVSFS